MKNQKKVYCCNCKYYWNALGGYLYFVTKHPNRCSHPSNAIEKSTSIEKKLVCKSYPEEINKNNDCQNYKKLWYKLGVK